VWCFSHVCDFVPGSNFPAWMHCIARSRFVLNLRNRRGSGDMACVRRIASPEMLPSADPLPHLKCSRPGFGGDRHEADQHDNT